MLKYLFGMLLVSNLWAGMATEAIRCSVIHVDTIHAEYVVVDSLLSVESPHIYAGFNGLDTTINCREDTIVQITNNTGDLWGFKHSSGFSGSSDTVTIITPGYYLIFGEISIEGIANKNFDIGIYNIDESRIEGYYSAVYLSTKVDKFQCTVAIITELLATDTRLIFFIRNTTDGTDTKVTDASIIMRFFHN